MSKLFPPRFSFYLSLCLLVLGLPCIAVRRAQGQPAVPPKAALPELNDAMGWTRAEYYKTIQPIDIDGDGQSEVLTRWIDGLHIYRFHDGALVFHSFLPALADKAGFSNPSWYETIHAAVLDPKYKTADILVRQADGMHEYRFDDKRRQWHETGSASNRPFGDQSEDGTDWSKPEYYKTIRLADLNRDGSAELIGRGKNGLSVYTWERGSGTWRALCTDGELADGDGYEDASSYETIQLVDVDRDGVPELAARSHSGVLTFRWTGSKFSPITRSGPFSDADGSAQFERFRSIHTFAGANGRVWLYGIGEANGSSQQGAIHIFEWKDTDWKSASTISLPGEGWNDVSQSSVLLAANLAGNAAPEFLVRTAHGVVAYTIHGKRLPYRLPGFSNAEGWSLPERYATLATASMHGDQSTPVPVILGRGRDGLQALKFEGSWQQAATSSFPDFCASGSNSPTCIAFSCLSTIGAGLFDGTPITNIRTQYGINTLGQGFWQKAAGSIYEAAQPAGPAPCPSVPPGSWQTVRTQLYGEASDIAVVAGWFDNNVELLNGLFNRKGQLLNEVVLNLNDIDGRTQVNTKWAGFGLDVASGLAGLLPGGSGLQAIISIVQGVISVSVPSDPTDAINNLYEDNIETANKSLTTNANQRLAYATDYGMLQQLGSQTIYWATTSSPVVTQAILGASEGFRIHYYKVIAPYKWQVAWCSQSVDFREVPCSPVDTPNAFYCQYGNSNYNNSSYHSNAYLTTGPFGPPLAWNAVGQLTGTYTNTGAGFNAIWYQMMLGSDLGWDFTANVNANGGYYSQTETELSYSNLEYGYSGPSSGCAGNGSNTGIQQQGQTLGQSLMVAQANTRHLGTNEVRQLDTRLAELQRHLRDSSTADQATVSGLSSLLSQASELLDRVYKGRAGSISATTPTLLMSTFIHEVERSDCNQREKRAITMEAYSILRDLEYDPASPSPQA